MRTRALLDRVLPGSNERVRPFLDVLAAALVVGLFWFPPTLGVEDRPRLAAGLALASVTGGAMILRRWFPTVSTATVAITTVAGTILGVCQDPMLAAAWCLYPLAVARASRTRTLVLVSACLFAGLAAVTGIPEGDASGAGQRTVLAVAALSVAWLLGTTVGRQVAAALAAERARVQLEVARDVHDVVGHALGVISPPSPTGTGSSPPNSPRPRRSASSPRHLRSFPGISSGTASPAGSAKSVPRSSTSQPSWRSISC
jgi:hypothetical protein